jgi:hypothetical protein
LPGGPAGGRGSRPGPRAVGFEWRPPGARSASRGSNAGGPAAVSGAKAGGLASWPERLGAPAVKLGGNTANGVGPDRAGATVGGRPAVAGAGGARVPIEASVGGRAGADGAGAITAAGGAAAAGGSAGPAAAAGTGSSSRVGGVAAGESRVVAPGSGLVVPESRVAALGSWAALGSGVAAAGSGVAAAGSGVAAPGSGVAAPGSGVVPSGAASVAAGSRVVPSPLAVGRSFLIRREPAACRWVVGSDTAAGPLSVAGPGELAGLGTVGWEPVPLDGGAETVGAASVAGTSAVVGGSLTLVVVVGGGAAGAGELLSADEAVPGSGTVAADPLAASPTTWLEVFAVSGTAVTVASAGAGTPLPAAAAVVAQIQPSTSAGSTARPDRATTRATAARAMSAERGVARLLLALPAGKELPP